MERDLVEDAALDPTIVAALHERDLMMLRRVGAQEDDPRIARDRELPLVSDLEPEKLGIEAHHGVEIVCVDANVADKLKNTAAQQGKSINTFALECIKKVLGIDKEKKYSREYSDLDDLFGGWSDDEFERINQKIRQERQIDQELWT